MVKVVAPAMSLDASGTLAGTLVFSKWKGRSYVRERVIPSNPKSGGQVGMRSMFKFLSQNWADLLTAEKATWEDLAADDVVSPFNAYMKKNQARWRNFKGVSKAYPSTDDSTMPTAATLAAAGGIRQATLTFTYADIKEGWAMILFRSPTPIFTASWANAIAIVPIEATSPTVYIDSPLDAGSYYYELGLSGEDGNYEGVPTEREAIVT